MDQRVTVAQVFSLTVESYELDGTPCSESILKVFVDPSILVQLLAWNNGAAHLKDHRMLSCADWNEVPRDVVQEVRMTLFTSYPDVLSGRLKPDNQGHYVFESGEAAVTVERGSVSIPDPRQRKNKRTNVRHFQFP